MPGSACRGQHARVGRSAHQVCMPRSAYRVCTPGLAHQGRGSARRACMPGFVYRVCTSGSGGLHAGVGMLGSEGLHARVGMLGLGGLHAGLGTPGSGGLHARPAYRVCAPESAHRGPHARVGGSARQSARQVCIQGLHTRVGTPGSGGLHARSAYRVCAMASAYHVAQEVTSYPTLFFWAQAFPSAPHPFLGAQTTEKENLLLLEIISQGSCWSVFSRGQCQLKACHCCVSLRSLPLRRSLGLRMPATHSGAGIWKQGSKRNAGDTGQE